MKIPAKTARFLLILLLGQVAAIAADKQSEGVALLRRGLELTDLRDSGPYHSIYVLQVNDRIEGKKEGTDELSFDSLTKWRRDLHLGTYDERALFLGQYMYRTRNLSYTPPSVRRDIPGSLRNLPETLGYKVLRVYRHEVNGAESRCVYLEQHRESPAEVTWCFDSSSGLPTALIRPRSRVEFSDYRRLGVKYVPGRVVVFDVGKQSGVAVLQTLDAGLSRVSGMFEPETLAKARRWCDDMQSPRPVAVPLPRIPNIRPMDGLEQVYELTIEADGTVSDVVPMAPSNYVDRIVTEAMRTWRFDPARCSDMPVPTDIVFRLEDYAHW